MNIGTMENIFKILEFLKKLLELKNLSGEEWVALLVITIICLAFFMFGALVTIILFITIIIVQIGYKYYIKKQKEKKLKGYQSLYTDVDDLLHAVQRVIDTHCKAHPYGGLPVFSQTDAKFCREKLDDIHDRAEKILLRKHLHHFINSPIIYAENYGTDTPMYYFNVLKNKASQLNNMMDGLTEG